MRPDRGRSALLLVRMLKWVVGLAGLVGSTALGIYMDRQGYSDFTVVATMVTCGGIVVGGTIGRNLFGWLKRRRSRRKGRKGVFNLQVDVPEILAAVNRRAGRIAALCGKLVETSQAKRLADNPKGKRGLEWSDDAAATIRPLARSLKKEADEFQADASRLSDGLSRWLEVAEREGRAFGLGEHVPTLITLAQKAEPISSVIRQVSKPYEQIRGLTDTLDAACGPLVEALQAIGSASRDMASTSRSSLLRIKKLLEREVKSQAIQTILWAVLGISEPSGCPTR